MMINTAKAQKITVNFQLGGKMGTHRRGSYRIIGTRYLYCAKPTHLLCIYMLNNYKAT